MLLTKPVKLVGPKDKTAILRLGLQAPIERRSATRLAGPRGPQPAIEAAPPPGNSTRGIVGTTPWFDHLRRGDGGLVILLEPAAVAMHSAAAREIARCTA